MIQFDHHFHHSTQMSHRLTSLQFYQSHLIMAQFSSFVVIRALAIVVEYCHSLSPCCIFMGEGFSTLFITLPPERVSRTLDMWPHAYPHLCFWWVCVFRRFLASQPVSRQFGGFVSYVAH